MTLMQKVSFPPLQKGRTMIHWWGRHWRQSKDIPHYSQTAEFVSFQEKVAMSQKRRNTDFFIRHCALCWYEVLFTVPLTSKRHLKRNKLALLQPSKFWDRFQNGWSSPSIFSVQSGKAIWLFLLFLLLRNTVRSSIWTRRLFLSGSAALGSTSRTLPYYITASFSILYPRSSCSAFWKRTLTSIRVCGKVSRERMASYRRSEVVLPATAISQSTANNRGMQERYGVEDSNKDCSSLRGASLVLMADAKLTLTPQSCVSRRATPRSRTRLAKIAARPLQRTTNLIARDPWTVRDGGIFIDRCAAGVENGDDLEV